MKFISTRNKNAILKSSEGILQGISKEGGLFVPCTFPEIKDFESLLNKNYREIALLIMGSFFPELGVDYLKESIDMAYDTKFDNKDIVPLINIDGINFLELYHGPTLAFKDMALSILPYLIKGAKKVENINEEIVILTATSGDTGKAALEGFANVEGVKIIVFYPEDGVSEVQKRQMITQEGDNTFVVGVRGNFDDAQSGVKRMFNNRNFSKRLEENNYILSSANSINIGRLIPQIVYYYYAYITMLKRKELKKEEKINIVVPTGNFGNILAAYYAKQMGLPVNKLICASNENNVLTEFLKDGIYDKRRDLALTSSPSMDILISSNLERLLYHLSGEDDNLIDKKMNQLNNKGYYEMNNLDIGDFYGNYAEEEEVSQGIEYLFKNNGYLIDPHTAVGYNVYEKYKLETKDKTKTIIASTASPFKFGSKVASSIGIDIKGKDEFTILEELSQKSNIPIPSNIQSLKNKAIIHKNTANKEEMEDMVKKFLDIGDKDD